jgi:hypothetical protein
MRRHPAIVISILLSLLAMTAPPVHAVLERTGPVSNAPSVGGYPAWYQDTTGIALEFCDPKNQAEVDGGWCLLLPGDPPAVPEVFPGLFFDEHFWYAADASLSPANGGRALLVLAVEAAFVADVAPGGQITFSRIRLRFDPVPTTGVYRFIHPYGEDLIEAAVGDRIFATDDVGINCAPGEFDCALQSRLGPFLLASATPGGAELPAVAGPSGLYIADPARSGPVTGSALPDFIACPTSAPCDLATGGILTNHNIFRIEGPAGSNLGGAGIDFLQTFDFALMGRLFTGTIPGRVDVNRASYTNNATGRKVDVFATGLPATQGRLPNFPRPPSIPPVLSFFDAACTGTVDPLTGDILPPFTAPAGGNETAMVNAGSNYWGQAQPTTIPAAVCVKDTATPTPVFFPKNVTDEITITEAFFDPGAQSLSVTASSSDTVNPPILTLDGTEIPATGQIVVTPIAAPPARVRVFSSFGGTNDFQVTTGFGGVTPPTGPVAVNDTLTLAEDSGAQPFNVLTNDQNAIGGTVAQVAGPQRGVLVLNADGTGTYTPNLNAFGNDSFTYTVTVNGITSNVANVAITITAVNDPPVANPDSFTAIVNVPATLNVLANDTDPDAAGPAVGNAVLVTAPAAGATVTGGAGGSFGFTATAAGPYTFTYQAQDVAGALSNIATVTVNVSAAETITVIRAELRNNTRLRVDGTVSPAAGQTLTIQFADGNLVIPGSQIFSAVSDAAGFWTLDNRNTVAPGNATQVKVTSSNGAVAFAPLRRR